MKYVYYIWNLQKHIVHKFTHTLHYITCSLNSNLTILIRIQIQFSIWFWMMHSAAVALPYPKTFIYKNMSESEHTCAGLHNGDQQDTGILKSITHNTVYVESPLVSL